MMQYKKGLFFNRLDVINSNVARKLTKSFESSNGFFYSNVWGMLQGAQRLMCHHCHAAFSFMLCSLFSITLFATILFVITEYSI